MNLMDALSLKQGKQMGFQTFHEVLDFLGQLDVSVMKLGLSRIQRVMDIMGNPQNAVPSIHIVGTNGKGSTSAILQSVYQASGYKTGLFTSPHLVNVQERIQVNGKPTSETAWVLAANAVYQAMAKATPDPKDWLTYFEFINAMAFWVFEDQRVDIAIIEAGLGGRLDSTNILASPLAVGVTPISYDHMDRLGKTLPLIASEKAGVFKHKVPVYSVDQPVSVLEVLQRVSNAQGAPLMFTDLSHYTVQGLTLEGGRAYRNVLDSRRQELYQLGLLGRYQSHNLALAMTIIEGLQFSLPVSQEAIRAGLKQVQWPGRFQYFPELSLIIDGSHNEAGFRSLLETLHLDFSDFEIHWGISLLENRAESLIHPLVMYPQTRSINFVTSQATHRFHRLERLTASIEALNQNHILKPSQEVKSFCLQAVSSGQALKVLTGSLYTAGEALRQISSH